MKTNKRPELILSLIALAGLAREVVSRYVQTQLFEYGYKWSKTKPGDINAPLHVRQPVLRVCSSDWNAADITFCDGPQYSDGPVIVFDVSQVELFLSRAREALIESRIINGVIVTITPKNVDLNVTDLVNATTIEAKKIQHELFGSELGSSPA